MKLLLCLMMILTPISRANSAILSTSKENKFCYTREQAEKINYCLEMQKVYEEIQLTRLNSPELNPPPQLEFWDTDIGKVLIFAAGVGVGAAVTVSFK